MSGFLALLDDVAAIAKLAAAELDDVAGQAAKLGAKVAPGLIDDAAKAGTKAAGVVIDDAAVTPKYVAGLPAARELPIVWKIARASVFNKVVILLPLAILMSSFAPWLITPLLMLGGCYLSYEGAEKIWHALRPHGQSTAETAETRDATRLEEARVAGAIKTDFILSAEIMTIALAAVETDNWAGAALVLALVAVGITALVYGAVAVLVKLDDAGLKIARAGRLAATRAFGRALVRRMPALMTAISTVGTAAMLWVGGSIVIHGLEVLGWPWPSATLRHLAETVGGGTLGWLVTATADALAGLALGLGLLPPVTLVLRFVPNGQGG